MEDSRPRTRARPRHRAVGSVHVEYAIFLVGPVRGAVDGVRGPHPRQAGIARAAVRNAQVPRYRRRVVLDQFLVGAVPGQSLWVRDTRQQSRPRAPRRIVGQQRVGAAGRVRIADVPPLQRRVCPVPSAIICCLVPRQFGAADQPRRVREVAKRRQVAYARVVGCSAHSVARPEQIDVAAGGVSEPRRGRIAQPGKYAVAGGIRHGNVDLRERRRGDSARESGSRAPIPSSGTTGPREPASPAGQKYRCSRCRYKSGYTGPRTRRPNWCRCPPVGSEGP